ncbi:insulinase family protein [Luteolibacter sp. LG18]|uniref:M16 family metallopeptidase n=1 Tax=Luteolibacter sp. LG18 TaxID=2819286 RepID=UPI002B2872C2|nr:peptidase M16 [Luteolibacter sp. LG18]
MQRIHPIAMAAILGASAAYFVPNVHADTQTPAKPEAAPAVKPRPWPQDGSDIPADSKAVFGTLPNGFRYLIYPNSEPPKRVSLRMHIATGSLMEADDQQGVAHFLEHMVFNGSKHYKPDELVPVMQRLGVGFGAHVNAFTSFDQTVYMLDLPELSEGVLDLGFNVMRDFGDGALLLDKEIDNERGVILSEKVSRDSVRMRLQEKQFAELLPGSLIANRFPIGKEDVISKAPRERFTDYYNRYYTPSRMTFVVVGDVDPAVMKERIVQSFGSMKNPENPGKNPDLGPVKSPEGLVAAVFTDKEVASTELSLVSVRPFEKKPDTTANRIQDMPLAMAHAMIGRRFDRLAKKENSPILGGGADKDDLFNHAELGSVEVTVTDTRWKEALPVLEQEFRRAMEFGFNESELAEAKANLLNAYQQAVKTKATRKSDTLASAIARSIPEEGVFSDPETDLAIAQKGLDALNITACHAALKDYWKDAGLHLILTAKEAPESAKDDLAAIYKESHAKPVTASEATKAVPFGYTDFGPAGKVVTEKKVEDLGITQLVLSNNVRVNLKKTAFDKDQIQLVARIGSGQLTQPKDKPGLGMLAKALLGGGGLGKHSADDLEQILAGKNVGATIGVGEDAFILSGGATPEDLELELQLACATLTDPGYREEALWQFRKALPTIDQQLKHSTAGPQTEMQSWLHGGDSRFTMPSIDKLAGYSIDDVKAWITPDLAKGYLELSVVGDFDEATIVPLLLKTFGALPEHAATKAPLDDLRKVDVPDAPITKTFTFDSKIPTAISISLWPTDGARGNTKEMRRLNILADIYGDRLREEIREKLGASYSPRGKVDGSDALIGFGFLSGNATAKPEDVDRLNGVMRDLADKLAKEGATADELDRAKKPVLASLDKTNRTNGYWLGTVLSQAQEDPAKLEAARERDNDYRSITLEEVNALAKKYLGADKALSVGIKPAE